MNQPDLATSLQGYRDFLSARKTLVLSTIDEDGRPFLAITPFVLLDGTIYIYVSAIVEHYEHLLRSEQVMVLFHADEGESRNLFAVERARFTCTARAVDEAAHEDVFERLRADHNASLVDLLRGLDFHLFALAPIDGRYVVGFGKAFDLDLEGDRFEHVVIDKPKDARPEA